MKHGFVNVMSTKLSDPFIPGWSQDQLDSLSALETQAADFDHLLNGSDHAALNSYAQFFTDCVDLAENHCQALGVLSARRHLNSCHAIALPSAGLDEWRRRVMAGMVRRGKIASRSRSL